MKIIQARSEELNIEEFKVMPGESWCIIGSNRSGIRPFFDLICGRLETAAAELMDLPASMGWVSFKDQQELYEQELKNDDTDFMDRLDPGTLGREFLKDTPEHMGLVERFGMAECLDKGYRQLSTGQTRKLLILSRITEGYDFLALQAPFEGLDVQSQRELSQALSYLASGNGSLILIVHNPEDIPAWCSHLALIENGRISVQGPMDQVIEPVTSRMNLAIPDFQVSAQDLFSRPDTNSGTAATEKEFGQDLVFLTDGSAGYGGRTVFSDLNLQVCQGQHTLITGPNGCGKSTLLHMITGDHPACYQNKLTIFNIQRGTGESIWDLKKRMGIVSPELHRNYYIPGPTLHCILSGLFDSIGIYRSFSRQQEIEAEQWLDRLGMADKASVPFRNLTFADQRLVLIARALIKQPDLLILDEPTQGLDTANRKALLDFLDEMTRQTACTILYVSHREDEFRPFFRQHIEMG